MTKSKQRRNRDPERQKQIDRCIAQGLPASQAVKELAAAGFDVTVETYVNRKGYLRKKGPNTGGNQDRSAKPKKVRKLKEKTGFQKDPITLAIENELLQRENQRLRTVVAALLS